jgi:hypothetical protein
VSLWAGEQFEKFERAVQLLERAVSLSPGLTEAAQLERMLLQTAAAVQHGLQSGTQEDVRVLSLILFGW